MTAEQALVERLAHARVLVLGDVMLDRYIYGSVERMSPEAPVPVLRHESLRAMAGGAGNVARNVAALGGKAVLIGLVGDDAAGRELCEMLTREHGIAPRLVIDPARRTTVKTRFVAGRQQLLRVDDETPAPASGETATALLAAVEAALPAVDIVLISDYAKGVLGEEVLQRVIAKVHGAGKRLIVDPKSRDFGRYAGADLLTPNRAELAAATGIPGEDDEQVAAAALKAIGSARVGAVLATRGERGMTLVTAKAEPLHLPAEAREVFDVSGAGDTVIATLAAALAVGADLPQAARLANTAAGIATGKLGTAVVHPADLLGALQARAVLANEAKVVALESALERIQRWRAAGERIAFTNGCFDLIHPGHISLLSQAHAAADRLIVGLNSDASIQRLKGPDRPVQNETARGIVLASLSAVDLVIVFEEDTPIELIRAIRPEVLVKGSDYRVDQVVGGDVVQSYGGRIMLADLLPGHSTTKTIARVGGSRRA
ncbi:MAG: D-beta-D-heptose 7-phosphate kinase / D-beta-D-heptose 1-phosphate adenosyltransferase [Rhodospirillaceae bacterium]|jgi:D-beta-D-heptose 7-phosphate kinase/D-beta-D-heptose 1-phosphate adenosyltransferase|nr:D-beta-D-heptose 7-phosphate kinase / D-beta-D-heptose 1-phosphate adenosyltransferase [Rhodospirillaceae bacterium]